MIESVLIANRGAIATRIIRTLRELGIRSITVYAEADRDSLHVQQADQSFSLGEGAAADTYLDQDKIFAIASEAGADAIHPGYGFLSENPDFVRRCEESGIAFLGPRPEQIEAFGLKHRARQLAMESDVALVPGSELLETVEAACVEADVIGYPVMLKSTAGGGGIGMQLCRSETELSEAFDSVRRLSLNNFGDSGVFIEKYIETSRHIEVQILGDGEGGVISLGARDCSLQRRNQKVLEETPPPRMSDEMVADIEATARRLMANIQYRSAGTVEFIYDVKTDDFYFLEVNTRLQVEHGVTEMVFGVDLVAWMVKLAQGELPAIATLRDSLEQKGHSIQVRLYAEDPNRNFQPCSGPLSEISWPEMDGLRIDHWLDAGQQVSAYFDPMLAKLIVWAEDRDAALEHLQRALDETSLYGIETNLDYLRMVTRLEALSAGKVDTHFLASVKYQPDTIDVLAGGTMTTVQDYPGRQGLWHIGVPPSGPFDDWSFRLGNRMLENVEGCAGLEITLNGPTLRFNNTTAFLIAGAAIDAKHNDLDCPMWTVINVNPGDVLQLGKIRQAGSRAYLLIAGGLQAPDYLGSVSTFTLGRFGGHNGRALQTGDTLRFEAFDDRLIPVHDGSMIPVMSNEWTLHVVYGPHGAPDFFTPGDIDAFFDAEWEVHYNSSRTGIRLIGPRPEWARSDGGEAGMHPSNLHDNAYAFGSIDFTGDMPVILGPDGPSLGGFVCPATVIAADRWKLGQLRAGDKLRFVNVSLDSAVQAQRDQNSVLSDMAAVDTVFDVVPADTPVVHRLDASDTGIDVAYRLAGDSFLLIEYGPMMLDISLRFHLHALMQWLQDNAIEGLYELTPGIRSLQVHYDPLRLDVDTLLQHLERAERALSANEQVEIESRIVHLPLSWDDEACRLAIDKYMQSVRKDAPWCPSNIEFIRRINGLDSIEDVKRIVFDASYLVMGLGDVYLGAPVATPLDPRHRLVTTKYNPARTWTAENSVGIGGAYLCIYGMEGPGGYQFVGRTLQMWNRDRITDEFQLPWLLRFFDQVRFYPVSADELKQIREDFPKGRYPLRIENTTFNLQEYEQYLADNADEIDSFIQQRDAAFATELQHWVESGAISFEADQNLADEAGADDELPEDCVAVESPVAGNVWQILVAEGDVVATGDSLAIIESMKMEIHISAPQAGRVVSVLRDAGVQVSAGQALFWLEDED